MSGGGGAREGRAGGGAGGGGTRGSRPSGPTRPAALGAGAPSPRRGHRGRRGAGPGCPGGLRPAGSGRLPSGPHRARGVLVLGCPSPAGRGQPSRRGCPPQSLLPAVSTRGPRTRKAPGTRVAVPPAAEAGPLRASVSSPVSRVGRWQETDLPPGRWQCGPRADARCLEGKWRRYHWGVAAPPGFRDKQPLKGQ